MEGRRLGIREWIAQETPMSVAPAIEFRGRLAADEIAHLRRASALTVVASSFENFPNTVLESLAHGCPTVATRVGGIPEIVRDGETGLLVAPDDPEALATAILRLLGDRAEAARLGAAAAEDVAVRFAPERIAEQTIDFYRTVIARWEESR